MKGGADDYLSKFVDLDALRAVVDEALLHLPTAVRRPRRNT